MPPLVEVPLSGTLAQAVCALAAGPVPDVPDNDPGPFDLNLDGWETIANVVLFAVIVFVVVFLVRSVKKKEEEED